MRYFFVSLLFVLLLITPRFGFAQSAEDFDLGRLIGKEGIDLSSSADLDALDDLDEVDVTISGGQFTGAGWVPRSAQDAIEIRINRSIPVVRLYYDFEVSGIVPPQFDTNGDPNGDPNDEADPQIEGVLGGFNTTFISEDDPKICDNGFLGARFQLFELKYGETPCGGVAPDNAFGVVDENGDVIPDVTRVISGWAGAVNPATKFNCNYPFPVVHEDGEDPRQSRYRFTYQYGGELFGAEREDDFIDRNIRGRFEVLSGPNAGVGFDQTTALNWDLRDRDDMVIYLSGAGKSGIANVTYHTIRFATERDNIPLDYIPTLPDVPNNSTFSCQYPSDGHDDDIYDQYSCVSTLPVRRGGFDDGFVWAKEDRSIFNPNMDLTERYPQLQELLRFEGGAGVGSGFAGLSLELDWNLGPWYTATQALASLPRVSVLATPASLPVGEQLLASALVSGYEGGASDHYTSWCIDDVPNQGVAAGGRVIPEEDAIDQYPSGELPVIDELTYDFNQDGTGDDEFEAADGDLRPCCRLITRTPDPGDDRDRDGIADSWEQRYFPAIVRDVTNVAQLQQVDPFGDPDNDGYLADEFKKRDGFFYWQLLEKAYEKSDDLIGGVEAIVDTWLQAFDLDSYFHHLPRRPRTNSANCTDTNPNNDAGCETDPGPPYRDDASWDRFDVIPFIRGEFAADGTRNRQRPPIDPDRSVRVVPDVLIRVPSQGIERVYSNGAGEGVPNIVEYIYGLDPTLPDTDGDGFSDGEELSGRGADDLEEKFAAKPGTKHTVRATTVGYSSQALLEIDSDESEFFVQDGEPIEVGLVVVPGAVTPDADARLEASVSRNEANAQSLVYEWSVIRTDDDGGLDGVGQSEEVVEVIREDQQGRGKSVLVLSPEQLLGIGYGAQARVEVRVLEEHTGRRAAEFVDFVIGDPVRLEWVVSGNELRACAVGAVTDSSVTNYQWSRDGVRDIDQSGLGDDRRGVVFELGEADRFVPFSIGVDVYNSDTGALLARVGGVVDVSEGASSDGACGDVFASDDGILDQIGARLDEILGRVRGMISFL